MSVKNFWPGIVWGIIIIFLSAMPGNYFPEIQRFSDWLSPDKIVHIVLYFVLCFLVLKGILKQNHHTKKSLILGLLFVVVFGGVLEILQHYLFTGRNGSIFDFLANLFGCVLSYILILYIERKKSIKSNRA